MVVVALMEELTDRSLSEDEDDPRPRSPIGLARPVASGMMALAEAVRQENTLARSFAMAFATARLLSNVSASWKVSRKNTG